MKKFYSDEYYKAHKYLELETDKLIYRYEILCVYNGHVDYNKFNIENIVKDSPYIYNIEYGENSEYLVFETKIDKNIISIISMKVN